ncbi:MAG: tRNA pseudouridine(38-40) synthase TruA [Terriglobia bacterium]
MRNITLTIAYDGTDFHGWQRQPELPTVQACMEAAVEKVTGAQASLCASGRTDAGVHALNQVANFKTECPIPCENLVKALNNILPAAIRVKKAREVDGDFHARYDARSKTYRYRILQTPICSPFLWRFVYHYPFPLDSRRMAEAARLLEGEHDFTSFAAAGEEVRSQKPEDEGGNPESRIRNSESPQREAVRAIHVSRLVIRARTSILIYEVKGSGFLHHMVRNIVGTLLEVGQGRLAAGEIPRILSARDRTLAGPTAPAQGLCLVKVEY